MNLLKKGLKKENLLKKALKKALKKVNLLKKGLKKEQPVKKVNSRKCTMIHIHVSHLVGHLVGHHVGHLVHLHVGHYVHLYVGQRCLKRLWFIFLTHSLTALSHLDTF